MKQENLKSKYWRCIACHNLKWQDVHEWVKGEPTCQESCSRYYKKFLKEIAPKRNKQRNKK